MSSSKTSKELKGNIEGKEVVASKMSLLVSEQTPNYFLVTSGNEVKEIFLDSNGQLSDGNALNGISVQIETERESLIKTRFQDNQSNLAVKGTKGIVLRSPMPGMVRAILVTAGEKVEKNTAVVVLEAMKMENSISAGFAGVVSKVYVKEGMSVEKGIPLIEFQS